MFAKLSVLIKIKTELFKNEKSSNNLIQLKLVIVEIFFIINLIVIPV